MTIKDDIGNLDQHAGKLEGHLPLVNLGDYWTIDNYNVSKLVIWFSNLTRYGTNFKKLNNVTLLDNEKEYTEAMAMYGAMAAIVAIALSVFLIVFCCYNCMFRSNAASRTPKYKGQGGRGGSWFCGGVVLLIAIAGAATFTVGIIGEVRLHNGAQQVCSTVDNVSNKTHSIHDETKNTKELQVDDALKKLDQPIKDIDQKVQSLGNPDLIKQIEAITGQYSAIKTQVKQANDQILDQLVNNKILDQMLEYIDPVQEECPQVAKYLRVGNLLVLIILAVSSLLFILGLCNNCFRSMVTLVGYIMLNVLIVFGIASFLALIVGSDFCMQSKPLVKKYIKTPVLDYYLYCNESASVPVHIHNPVKRNVGPPFIIENVPAIPNLDTSNLDLNKLFTEVKEYISNATEYTEQFNGTLTMLDASVQQICEAYINSHPGSIKVDNPQQLCKDLKDQVDIIKVVIVGAGSGTNPDSLLGRMNSVSGSVSSIINTVECQSLSQDIDQSLTNLCTNIYEAFFFFLMNSLAAILCFYIMLIFTVWMLF